MTKHKSTTLPIGTISEGTLRPEDLIPAFLYELERLRLTKAERAQLRAITKRMNDDKPDDDGNGYYQAGDSDTDLDELTQILESHVPDYCYFGTLEGDGACFGVWPSFPWDSGDWLPNDERKINAGDPFPTDVEGGHVFTVSDHGNVTLYRRSGHRWIEVWSVV